MTKKASSSKKILKFLDKEGVLYKLFDHKTVYTAYDLAQTLKEDLNKVAKSLLIKKDKDRVIVVLPASRQLDLSKFKKKLKAKKISIEPEKAIAQIIKGTTKALTPFGRLYKDIPVYVDKALLKTKEVITSAGDFEQSLHLKTKDLLKATQGEVVDLGRAVKRSMAKPKAKRHPAKPKAKAKPKRRA